MPKTPLTPIAVGMNDAVRLSGVSRARICEWIEAGLLSPRYNGSRLLFMVADLMAVLDGLPRGSKSTGPLLPLEDQALAKERAGEPDFNHVFTECFERLVPSLGEDESRRRALAHTIRAYRRHHECAFKPARVAALALIELEKPPAPELADQQQPVGEPEPPAPVDQRPSVEPAIDLARVYADRLKLLRRNVSEDEARARAFEFTVRLYRDRRNCDLETAKAAVLSAIESSSSSPGVSAR
jgi:hypothetical protein